MSDAFLQKCEDKRPGLIYSSRTAKEIERERKQKESNEKNRTKPKKVLEQEKRTEGLSTAITSDNKGFSLLQKMGYKPGMVLGKRGTGRAEPVPVELKTDRGGLGKEAEAKRKAVEMQAMRASMMVKRKRMELMQKESFVQHMSSQFANKNVGRDLGTSQKACHQMDTQDGFTEPIQDFYWPPGWKTLKEAHADITGEVEETVEEEEEEQKEEEEEDEEDEGQPLTDEEKLSALTDYLRTTYHYCIWCGTKYEDVDDMKTHCPGDNASAHD